MRALLSALIAVLITAAGGSAALANPVGDLTQMQDTFLAAKSFHADITTRDNKHLSVDVIRPDRFRGSLVGGVQAIIIGPTVWTNKDGQWHVDSSGKGSSGDYLQNARQPMLSRPAKLYNVTELGPSSVGSTPARLYRFTHSGVSGEAWVGSNQLPLRIQLTTSRGTTNILFSNFNNISAINPPM